MGSIPAARVALKRSRALRFQDKRRFSLAFRFFLHCGRVGTLFAHLVSKIGFQEAAAADVPGAAAPQPFIASTSYRSFKDDPDTTVDIAPLSREIHHPYGGRRNSCGPDPPAQS